MAIHPDHPGLTVEVTVDDQPLEEYTDADDVTDPKTITRYTDARYGAEFAIKFNFESPFPANSDVGYKIWVDGKLVKAAFVYQRQLLIRGPYITSGAKIKGKAGWYLQRFCFADLRITEDCASSECYIQDKMPALGTITISLEFGKAGTQTPMATSFPIAPVECVPETALKGQAKPHQVGIGSIEKVQTRELWKSSWKA